MGPTNKKYDPWFSFNTMGHFFDLKVFGLIAVLTVFCAMFFPSIYAPIKHFGLIATFTVFCAMIIARNSGAKFHETLYTAKRLVYNLI